MTKNATSDSSVIAPSADLKRWSAYPNGDKPVGSYSTTFPADENPISEGSAWYKNPSNSWQKIQTTGGNAIAAAYTEVFDDAYAYLQNWSGNDYEVTATVLFNGANSGEVEILLRAADTSSTVNAYEILVNTSGTAFYVVRWNGALGDYTQLAGPFNAGITGVNGMQMRARLVGSTLNCWARATSGDAWTQAITNLDLSSYSPYLSTGKPGMAIYVHAAGGNRSYIGFQDYQVTAL